MRENFSLIIQLHGAGERGNGQDDLVYVDRHGFTERVFTGAAEHPCILVMPQCPKDSSWVAEIENLMRFIEQVCEEFRVDTTHIYLTGLSMGGSGVWYAAMRYPDKFRAIAPVCGVGMPWNAGVLKMPVWAFHGKDDMVVKASNTIDMVEILSQTNAKVRMTLYENTGHDSWHKAYTQELLNWLLEQ